MSDDIELPPLPESLFDKIRLGLSGEYGYPYTAEQMTTYARAAILADRVARRKLSAVKEALMRHRLLYMRDNDGEPLCLLDALCGPYAADALDGEAEIMALAKALAAGGRQ